MLLVSVHWLTQQKACLEAYGASISCDSYLKLRTHIANHTQVESVEGLGAIENKSSAGEVLAVQNIGLEQQDKEYVERLAMVIKGDPCLYQSL
jgi:hypothetical protein